MPQSGGTGGVRTATDANHSLVGTTWTLDGITDGDSVSSVPRGISATLCIADGRIHFFDGLNDYDGPVQDGDRLVVGSDTVQIRGPIAGSGAGCAGGHICSVDMTVLTRDFHYRITGNHLTVTGLASTAGTGLTFVANDRRTAATGASAGPTPHPLGK